MQTDLALDGLTLPKEKTYFAFVLIVSILGWLVLGLTIIGLLYALAIGFFIWLAHGLLIAHLKSESVLVSETQMPRLHEAFRRVCERLALPEMPELYVLQAGGLLNAFATRFLGRNFVVLYSDMLEAHGEDSPQIEFILGHEIGHIKRGHLLKHLFLFPGTLLPLLGPAYHRACEGTCDRHGAFACCDIDGAMVAMMVLSGGKLAGSKMDPHAFANQHQNARGFFVSWHELLSGYPTLSQRVYNLICLRDHVPAQSQRRHPLAYLFGLFAVGGSGGAGGLLVTIAIIAMLAGIALPVFAQVRKKAEQTQMMHQRQLQQHQSARPQSGKPVDDE